MKKNLFALLAIAAAFASCSSDDVLVEEVEESNGPAIGFHVYTDKMTRADANNSAALQDFYTTFNVYGWKYVSSDWSPVFENVTNEYFASTADKGETIYTSDAPNTEWGSSYTTGWYYEGIRYWDKMATKYQFDAYTPISVSDDVTCSSDGKILYGASGKEVTVDTKNLMATPSKTLAYKGFDKDFMTATSTATKSDVDLTFTHELAKLNIKLALSDKTTTKQAVTVKDVQIFRLGKSSYFDNSKETEAGYVTSWSTPTDYDAAYHITTDYQLNGETAGTDNFNDYYVMEQLMIPQTIVKANVASQVSAYDFPDDRVAYVYVEYTIGTETFKGYYALANIFGTGDTYSFEGGNQYTLTITVGPDPIHFAASVTTWADEVTGSLNAN